MKFLAELERTPLEINIEMQLLFKYLQRFAFIEKNVQVLKVSQEENLVIDEQIKYMKTVLKFLRLGNLMRNIYKVVCEEISK